MHHNIRRLLHDSSTSINIPLSPSPLPSPKPSSSSSTALAALFILLAFFFTGFFSAYVHRHCRRSRSRRHSEQQHVSTDHQQALPEHRPRNSVFSEAAYGLNTAVVEALPVLSYSSSGGKELGCVVCLRDFEEKERVKVIPGCGHAFHPECIDVWLVCKGSCPICRCTDMFAGDLSLKSYFVEGEGRRKIGRSRSWSRGERLGLEVGEVEAVLRRSCSL